MNILKNFLKYISIDSTSDSSKKHTPSSNGQTKLAKFLFKQLKELKLDKVFYDKKQCYIYGILKGNHNLPKIGFMSHLDTAENLSKEKIKPKIIKNYNGKDIILNENIILSPNDCPDLKNHIGKTIITTKGTTILGADNKAGIAEIMYMLNYFSTSNEEHGDIFICFNPDEEIGLGISHLNKKYFNPDFAYTVDGLGIGELSYENFYAATAKIHINGINAHYGKAKEIMINSCHLGTLINSKLPKETPENTENKEGFFHLREFNGNISKTYLAYLICDFNKNDLEKRKQKLQKIINNLNKKYNNCIKITFNDSYQNMYEILKDKQDLINSTLKAISITGIKPKIVPHRGCTDGSDISFKGIPCPNLGAGVHNYHSVYEYVCLEDLIQNGKILISIVNYFSNL